MNQKKARVAAGLGCCGRLDGDGDQATAGWRETIRFVSYLLLRLYT